jgi:prophage antirepressor-like protein
MNNNVKVFDFNSNSIRIVNINDKLMFVAKDVTDLLGYIKSSDGLRIIPDKNKGTHLVSTLGGNQRMRCVDESGLYRLVLRSDKEESTKFMDWVVDDVLPSIRKNGFYADFDNKLTNLDAKQIIGNMDKANSEMRKSLPHANFNDDGILVIDLNDQQSKNDYSYLAYKTMLIVNKLPLVKIQECDNTKFNGVVITWDIEHFKNLNVALQKKLHKELCKIHEKFKTFNWNYITILSNDYNLLASKINKVMLNNLN